MRWLFALLHHLAAFSLVSALVVEAVLLHSMSNDPVSARTARRIQLADLAYGVSAGVLLVAGLLRVIYFEKGMAYYVHSGPFLAKIWLFGAVALLSLYPTFEYVSWNTSLKLGLSPAVREGKARVIRGIIRAELAGIVLIILCAVLMARG
jgi:putative membrane protein